MGIRRWAADSNLLSRPPSQAEAILLIITSNIVPVCVIRSKLAKNQPKIAQYPTYLHTNPLKNSSSGQKRRKNNTTQKHYTIYRLF